jgi:hypothetical protein
VCVSAVVAVVERSPGAEEYRYQASRYYLRRCVCGVGDLVCLFCLWLVLRSLNVVAQRLRLSCARYTVPSPTPAIAHLCDETTRLAPDLCRLPNVDLYDAGYVTPFVGASSSALQNAHATRTTFCDTGAPPTSPRASRGMTLGRRLQIAALPRRECPVWGGLRWINPINVEHEGNICSSRHRSSCTCRHLQTLPGIGDHRRPDMGWIGWSHADFGTSVLACAARIVTVRPIGASAIGLCDWTCQRLPRSTRGIRIWGGTAWLAHMSTL